MKQNLYRNQRNPLAIELDIFTHNLNGRRRVQIIRDSNASPLLEKYYNVSLIQVIAIKNYFDLLHCNLKRFEDSFDIKEVFLFYFLK